MNCDVGKATEGLENELCHDYMYELCSFSNLSVTSPTSQLILQPFRRFTYVPPHSPTIPLLDLGLRHSSLSNASFASPTSQALHLINLASSSPTFPSLHLRHNSFSNPSVALTTSQLILQPFRCFTYVTVHSPTFFFLSYFTSSSLNSPGELISNLSVTSPTSQLIIQPFRCFTYITAHSPTIPLLHLRHSSFSNPSFASPTSQDFHLCHLASRP